MTIASDNAFACNRGPDNVINLWPSQPEIFIEVFLPKSSSAFSGIVICPGGGYANLCKTYEGYDIAQWLNSLGIAAFVLNYHVASKSQTPLYPWPIKDGRKAVSLVRSKAEEFAIKEDRIGILGFSAGGHLASSIGTHWQNPDSNDIVNGASCRPDFMVLIYPVLSFRDEYCHMGSRRNLIGQTPDDSLVRDFSNELQVDPNTPPAFLVHANDDKSVPVENTLMFYSALKKAGVNAEVHIFSRGGHGFAMGLRNGNTCDWRPACIEKP